MRGPQCYSGAVVAALLLVTITKGGAQVQCYSAAGCGSGDLVASVSTISDCCLGQRDDGLFYTSPSSGGVCIECTVFGFDLPGQPLESPAFIAEESITDRYSLPIRMIKGRIASRINIVATVQPGGTAVEGQNDDFFIDDKTLTVRPGTGTALQVTFRVDNVTLEEDETFQLVLTSDVRPSDLADESVFFVDTLNVTIQDPDGIEITFSESDYSASEGDRRIQVTVQTEGRRATPVTVRVTPLTYNDFLTLRKPLPEDFPDVPDSNRKSPNRASDKDFSNATRDVTFPASNSAGDINIDIDIPVNDDGINEGGEVFVVIVELVSAVDEDRVDLSLRNTSLCRIGDNDDIEIGFEFAAYTYPEGAGLINIPATQNVIFLVKSIESEQTYDVIVRASRGGSAEHQLDYSIGFPGDDQFHEFEPDQDRILISIDIRDDTSPEGTEIAQLVSLQEDGSIADFNPSVNATTNVFITDDGDSVVIELDPPGYVVVEDVGTVEYTLTVIAPEPRDLLPVDVFVDLETVAGSADVNDYVEINFRNSPLFDPFNNETRMMSFTVTIIDDRLFELTEEFSLTLTPSSSVDVQITPNVSVITLLDNDFVRIGFNETAVSVAEDEGPAALTVGVLNGALGTSVFVNLSTSDGSALAVSDYTAISDLRLEFSQSQLSVPVNVGITDDLIFEDLLEFFQARLTLDGPILGGRPGAITISPDLANIDIRDNDAVTIGFDPVRYNISENGFAFVTVQVLRGSLSTPVRVQFDTEDGTALAGLDYDAVSQVLEFNQSVNDFTIMIPIWSDSLVEIDESIFSVLTLLSVSISRVTIAPARASILITDDDSATIGFSARSYNIRESAGTVTLTVLLLQGELGRDIFINLQTLDGDGGGVDGSTALSIGPEPDYTSRTATLKFNQTVGIHTVFVPITNDSFLEYNERLRAVATLTTDADRVTLDPDIADITVIDDDNVVIGFEFPLYQVELGENDVFQTIRINLVGQLRRNVRIRFYTEQDTAIDGDDYTGVDQVLTFIQGDTGRDINIRILGDTILEPTEQFFGRLETSDPDVRFSLQNTRVDIRDSGVVRLTFGQPLYTFSEGARTGVVYVDKIGDTSKELSVNVTGALQPKLNRTLNQVLTFATNESEKCVEFEIADDAIALEPDQQLTFSLELIGVTGVQLGHYNSTTITIEDNDVLSLGLEIHNFFTETIGVAQAFITFSTRFSTGFTINVATLEAHSSYPLATAGLDYIVPSSTFFADPASSVLRRPIGITIINDRLVEEALEGFTFEISLPVSAPADVSVVNGSRESGIEDNDDVTIGFDDVSVTAREMEREVTFTVSVLRGFLDRAVEVTFTTSDGTAIGGLDFVNPGPVVLQFDNTTRSRSVRVIINDDDILEEDENFFGNIATVDAAVIPTPAQSEATIIEDNDNVTIGFQPSSYSVYEFERSVTLTVVLLVGQLDRDVQINFYTMSGTAVDGVEFMIPGGGQVLTFSPTQRSVDVTVTIIDDDIVENSEDFAGLLSNPLGERVNLDPATALVTILDSNDTVTIGFAPTAYSTEEGTTVEVYAEILSGTLDRDAVVTVSSRDGSADVGADYTPVNIDLMFSSTINRSFFEVFTIEDVILEADEQFLLDLTTADPSVIPDPAEATVTILDDDGVVIGLEDTGLTVNEGEPVEVCAILINGTLEREVTVVLQPIDGTATAGDFAGTPLNLVFDENTTRSCANVFTLGDSIYENSEVFTVTLAAPTDPDDVTLDPSNGTVTILDDNEVTIGFERPSYVVTEPEGTVEVCAVVSAGILETDVEVEFSTSDDSAEAPDDYTSTVATFTFSPGSRRDCTDIPVINDMKLEAPEQFFGVLDTSADRVVLSPNQTTVSIGDDDGITIGFRPVLYRVGESDGVVTLSVAILSGELEDVVNVRLFTGDDTAIAPDDYSSLNTTLRFNSTQTQQSIDVSIKHDVKDELNEEFLAFLENITFDSRVTIFPNEAPVIIEDDDSVTIGLLDTVLVLDEEVGTVEVCARILSGDLDREITVTISTTDGTAIAPEDYLMLTADLVFDSDTDQVCVDVTIVNNPEFEGNETFDIIISTLDDETTLNPSNATLTIEDNDGESTRNGSMPRTSSLESGDEATQKGRDALKSACYPLYNMENKEAVIRHNYNELWDGIITVTDSVDCRVIVWRPPNNPEYEVASYEVRVYYKIDEQRTNASTIIYQVSNLDHWLEPSTFLAQRPLFFQVRAVDFAGQGQWSSENILTDSEDCPLLECPLEPVEITRPGQIQQVQVMNRMVMWYPPESTGGEISLYMVRVYYRRPPLGFKVNLHYYNTEREWVVLSETDTERQLYIQVRAQNSAGIGLWSREVQVP